MEKEVLTIEQMQELIDLGIDTSSASAEWQTNDFGTSWVQKGHGMESVFGYVPAFTLQDILKLFPKFIIVSEESESEYVGKNYLRIGYPELADDLYIMYTKDAKMNSAWACFNAGRSLIDAAFQMLKWLKQSGNI